MTNKATETKETATNFAEGSNTDNYDIDHGKTGEQGINNENPDTNANPDGVFKEEKIDIGIPDYILAEFTVSESNHPVTGAVRRYLNVRPEVVEATIAGAPKRLEMGMDRMTDEDYVIAEQLSKDIISLIETCSAVDEFLGNGVLYNMNNEIARGAVKSTRWRNSAISWNARLQGKEAPEGLNQLMDMVSSSNRRIAIVHSALSRIPEAKDPNYKAAAWQELRMEAQKKGESFFGSAENKATGTENANNATATLLDNM